LPAVTDVARRDAAKLLIAVGNRRQLQQLGVAPIAQERDVFGRAVSLCACETRPQASDKKGILYISGRTPGSDDSGMGAAHGI